MTDTKKVTLVCLGGGTGLSTLLSGLKHNPWFDISAIVTMFDSGGSSGQLRDRFGVLPSGDVARCVLALAENELYTRKVLLKRIPDELQSGHTAANMMLLGFEQVLGSYQKAVDALCYILEARGRVYPVSLEKSNLCAQFTDGSRAVKETEIDRLIREGKEVKDLCLDPAVAANPDALNAIAEADLLCVSPGSFYTSVLPNFLPLGVKQAISRSQAPLIAVLNLMTEGGGMLGYTAPKFVAILERYIGRPLAKVIVNNHIPPNKPATYAVQEQKFPVPWDDVAGYVRYVRAPLWLDGTLARHDPQLLASLMYAVVYKLLNS